MHTSVTVADTSAPLWRRVAAELRRAARDRPHRVALLGGTGALAIVVLWGLRPAPNRARAETLAPLTKLAVVERKTVEDLYTLTGELRAVRSLEIRAPQTETSQLQIRWLAEDGADVRAGDPIVEFDNTNIAQTLEEKRLRITQATLELSSRQDALAADAAVKQVAVDRAQTEAEEARIEAEVPQELRARREWHQKQTALHEKETVLLKARQELAAFAVSAKADLDNLRIAREKAERELASAERTLAALSIRAPRDGIVVIAQHPQTWSEDRKLQAGDSIWMGNLVASMPELEDMEITALLPEVDEGRITPGLPARCTLDAYPERIFPGAVDAVGSVAEENRDRSGFRARLSLQRSDGAIMRPGMSVRAQIVRKVWTDVLTIPRAALRWTGARASVRPARGQAREVKVAQCLPLECIVSEGLAQGERVRY